MINRDILPIDILPTLLWLDNIHQSQAKVEAWKFFFLKEVCWILGHFARWRVFEKTCVRFVNLLFKTTVFSASTTQKFPRLLQASIKLLFFEFPVFFFQFLGLKCGFKVARSLDQDENVSPLLALLSCVFPFSFV